MTIRPRFARFTHLLLLVPQMLVLGFGGEFVVCLSSNGHLQVEALTSECCSALGPPSTTRGETLAGPQTEPLCGSCSDFRLLMDADTSQNDTACGPDYAAHATALLPNERPSDAALAGGASLDGRLLDRGRVPLRLICLRSVLQLC